MIIWSRFTSLLEGQVKCFYIKISSVPKIEPNLRIKPETTVITQIWLTVERTEIPSVRDWRTPVALIDVTRRSLIGDDDRAVLGSGINISTDGGDDSSYIRVHIKSIAGL